MNKKHLKLGLLCSKWWERDANSKLSGLESGGLTTRPRCHLWRTVNLAHKVFAWRMVDCCVRALARHVRRFWKRSRRKAGSTRRCSPWSSTPRSARWTWCGAGAGTASSCRKTRARPPCSTSTVTAGTWVYCAACKRFWFRYQCRANSAPCY